MKEEGPKVSWEDFFRCKGVDYQKEEISRRSVCSGRMW